MKKKVLAVLLAICMIAGTCVLFASAADKVTKDQLVDKNTGLVSEAKVLESGKDYNIKVTVTNQTKPQVNTGTTVIDANNVDSVLKFGSYNFKSALSPYFTVSGSVKDGVAKIKFTPTDTNKVVAYRVTAETLQSTEKLDGNTVSADQLLYVLAEDKEYVVSVEEVSKLCKWTIGVHFYGDSTKNLVAAEIAKVTATVQRQGGAAKPQTVAVVDYLYDLLPGDIVTLTTSLKDKADAEYYAFNCWVDGSGNVIDTSPTITRKVEGDASIYAVYVELKSRFTIDYSVADGEGELKYVEGRETFKGDAQISVLQGKTASFIIAPKEGFEITKVVVDGKNIASFKHVFRDAVQADGSINTVTVMQNLKDLINATGGMNNYIDTKNANTVANGEYSFQNVERDHTIVVTFGPKTILEAPEGNSLLAPVEPEGLELETGAADADANGSNGGDATTVPAENGAAGNGGSAVGGVVNPATGSGSAIAVFAVMTVAAGAAFVTMKKKED